MKKFLLSVLTAVAGVLAPCVASATPFDDVLTQYTAAWQPTSGYKTNGAVWDPNADYGVTFGLLPTAVQTLATSANGLPQYNAFVSSYQGRLRSWAQTVQAQGLTGDALVTAERAFLDGVFNANKAALASQYPGYPDDVYKALVVQNLAHAFYVYGTSYYYETITNQVPGQQTTPILTTGQLTMAQELRSLLELTTADCGETAELVRVLGRVWGLDMRYLGVQPDYLSSIARERVQTGAHAFDILVFTNAYGVKNALFVDSVTNMAIAPGPVSAILPAEMVGDGIIASTAHASDRYLALMAQGRILAFFDYYMHPPIRSGYLKSSAYDSSLIKFMYAYYLEAYPNPGVSYVSYPAWQVNNQSYSLQQPLE